MPTAYFAKKKKLLYSHSVISKYYSRVVLVILVPLNVFHIVLLNIDSTITSNIHRTILHTMYIPSSLYIPHPQTLFLHQSLKILLCTKMGLRKISLAFVLDRKSVV